MDDRLNDVVMHYRKKVRFNIVPSDDFLTLVTTGDLEESEVSLIRAFQRNIHQKLGLELIVVGGQFGCVNIHFTIRNVPKESLRELLNTLLSLDVFREEASKAGFFAARSQDISISLDPGVINYESGPVPGLLLFISYEQTDEVHLTELEKHLRSLSRQGLISPWHRRKIAAGTEGSAQVDLKIKTADIILLLVSADFIASDYCNDQELLIALRRHEEGKTRVIPIIVRAVDWTLGGFSHLQVIPRGGIAVASWQNSDEAWAEVAKEIRIVAQEINLRKVAAYIKRNDPLGALQKG